MPLESAVPYPDLQSPRCGVLRIGVLLDSFVVPAWVHTILADVQSSEIARVSVVVRNATLPAGSGAWRRVRQTWVERAHFTYAAYEVLDRRLFQRRPDPFLRINAGELLANVPVLDVVPHQSRWSDRFPSEALKHLHEYQLDVALRFGFRILRGDVLRIARHGVWSFHHDDADVIRGGPPCFWEVMEGHPVTGSVLQILTERLDGGRTIYRSWSSTHPRSVARNREQVYWKSAAFVMRRLRDLHRTGSVTVTPGLDPDRSGAAELRRKPTNRAAVPLLARFAARAAGQWLRARTHREQWLIAYRFHDRPPTTCAEVAEGVRPLVPPLDRSWADPFPLCEAGRTYVLLEEYPFARRRGHIAALELGPMGPIGHPVPVLERPYHLSYPFTFRWEGEVFMIPESSQARSVELYRCTRAPDRWELVTRLFDGVRATDVSVVEAGDRWWLFACMSREETPTCHDELFVFHAPRPTGPWTPHDANPVVSDARRARPAGAPFMAGDSLHRPAQDCSGRYGLAVRVQRVLRLNPREYSEETVDTLSPTWLPGLLGTHTLNRGEGLILIDGVRRIPRTPAAAFRWWDRSA